MSQTPDPMEEIKANFFVECEELLEALQDGLQAFSDDNHDEETIHVIFRAVHSIKGGAGAFGLDALVKFAHRFETLLDKVRAGKQVMNQACVQLCLQAADHLSDIIDKIRTGGEDPSPNEALNTALDNVIEAKNSQTSAMPDQANFAHQQPHSETKKTTRSVHSSVVRVELDRVERLVNLVGELVINQSMLSQSLKHVGLPPHSAPLNDLEEYQRLTRDIQDSVMQIRAQPMKSLFQRMARVVREVSSDLKKPVQFSVTGEATELDKTVIERLAEPLTHMVRNAIDHGIENAEQRRASGKDENGQLFLSAAHRSGRIIIELTDDGAGIDRAKVRQTAIDKGLVASKATMTDQDIDNLLFLPGFSTSATVSDLSGRGVGMDVVRNAIQTLGGRVSIKSTPNEGTQIIISLPLTLAVMDGLIVEAAGETLVVPLTSVVETLTLEQGAVDTLFSGARVLRNHNFAPIIDLAAALGYRAAGIDFTNMIAIFVQLEDDRLAAFAVDNILDQRQVVVKGLDDQIHRAPGVVAATILGDGRIALIVDPADITATAEPSAESKILELATGT